MSFVSLLLILSLASPVQGQDNALFAFVTIKTSLGDIRVKLYKKDAPRTVDNFLQLALGRKSYRNAKTGKKVKDLPFYKDMVFHKIHPDLAIQTGCPWGTGKGWPGFTMKEERNELRFDRPFLMGMSKIQGDPNSVGSQFFITTVAAPHLDKDHTVIGEVIQGEDVVRLISQQKRDAMMKPLQPIKMIEVVVDSE